MKLFLYYAVHSFFNQLKKLFKTWILIFIVACALIGGLVGLFAASVSKKAEELSPEEQAEVQEEPHETPPFLEGSGMDGMDLAEIIVGVLVVALLAFFSMNAEKKGSKIFLPADVNLLFASPMKPQSVLMFRLVTQLGVALLASIYLIFQLPNLILNLGMSVRGAVVVIFAWCITIAVMTLIRVFLYILSSCHPWIKKNLHHGILLFLLLFIAGYVVTILKSGSGYLRSANLYLNWSGSRWIPVWGWMKGAFLYAMEDRIAPALLCFALLILFCGVLIFLTWRMKADFYEDAMAQSEETAELLERAQSEKGSAAIARRKKADRSARVRRDGMRYGCGANVFFFKSLYNRFRFAHLHFFTKMMETYLAAAVATCAICRFGPGTASVIPMIFVLAAAAFFRTLGNPLSQDTRMDYFVMIPESTWAKLFWSLMGGTANCLLDVLPAILAGTAVLRGNLLSALVWVPFILSVDFYGTNVGAFISLSVPVSAGKNLKQIVQVMFVYFGLLPDALLLVLGLVFDHVTAAAIGSAVINIGLGMLFFGLTPLFLDPRGGSLRTGGTSDADTLRTASRSFSRMGIGCVVLLLSASVLQVLTLSLLQRSGNGWSYSGWGFWLCAFLPIYLVGVPLACLVIRRAPAQRPAPAPFSAGQLAVSAVICVFMMYAGNFVGTLATSFISSTSDGDVINAVAELATGGSVLPKLLFMVIVGPIAEELIFRRMLIDRMRPYGEKLAVLMSAAMFGLFHGNLSQMFYAFALGLVFGYVYLRSGKLRYSVILHMVINFLGSIVAPYLLSRIDGTIPDTMDIMDPDAWRGLLSPGLAVFGIYSAAMLCLAAAGLVLLCVRARRVRFSEAEHELQCGTRFRVCFLNTGMILFVVCCLGLVILSLFTV